MVDNEHAEQLVDVLARCLDQAGLQIVARQVDHVELDVAQLALYLRHGLLELADVLGELLERVLLLDELGYLALGRAVHKRAVLLNYEDTVNWK